MKNLIILSLLALSAATFSSCGNSYECDCPPGKSHKVTTTDEIQAKKMCEDQGCTL